jgi:3-hydroxyacyl-CoA dehydrogenase
MSDVLDKPTTSPISTRKHGDVLIVLSNNPPVNALSTAVRQGLVDAIAEAEADESVNAVVIACEGQTFFAGADITEFGKPPQQPWLPAVVDTIENCSKPVVAAIHGTALGGGLEVALACHYRVADPTAKLGTPEWYSYKEKKKKIKEGPGQFVMCRISASRSRDFIIADR